MKKCNECSVEMIEDTSLHTDYVGGVRFEEQIYLSYVNGKEIVRNVFGKEKEKDNDITERVKARVCPNCGKVELFINVDGNQIS